MNRKAIESETTEIRDKIKAVLSTEGAYSWGILTDNYQLVEPQNTIIREITSEISKTIPEEGCISGEILLSKYLKPPYTLNIYSLTLVVSYILGSTHEQGILIVYDNNQPIAMEEVIGRLFEDKKSGLNKILTFKYGYMEKNIIEKNEKILITVRDNEFVERGVELSLKLENVIDG